MDIHELEAKLICLMSFPLKAQVKIDFDKENQRFSLSVPIYRSGKKAVPPSIQRYVKAREGKTFQPHSTSFHHIENEVKLIQNISFHWGFQPGLRDQVLQFWNLAKKCHQMLMEIGAEEKLEQIE